MSIPSPKELLSFLEGHNGPVAMREIAKIFHLKGRDRALVRASLRVLEDEGKISRQGRLYQSGEEIGEESSDALLSTVIRLEDAGVWVAPTKTINVDTQEIWVADPKGLLEVGDQALVQITGSKAKLLRVLPRTARTRALGIFERIGDGGVFISVNRKDRQEYVVAAPDRLSAENGDFVEAELQKENHYRWTARIKKVFGPLEKGNVVPSDIAIAQYEIPNSFSAAALKQANDAKPLGLDGREDLRDIPLITIDDEDARDFDDAIWAKRDDNPKNPDGWILLVAIADVAAYVTPDSPLDQESYERGNSVYFPDKVVPMLPEALSNELCSLKPHVERACLAVYMTINKDGKLTDRRFVRGLMKSAARVTYKQVQGAVDQISLPKEWPEGFMKEVIDPLYGAYATLKKARDKRGALELNLPEQKVLFDSEGEPTDVVPRTRFDSHRLIEEFMVLANVAAASTLDDAHILCLFRIHDEPGAEKVEALFDFLRNSHLEMSKGQRMSPKVFNGLLERAAGSPMERAVNELVLRTQARAEYNPENIGHFGLGLARYSHFTSPIRRYADLVTHRGLLAAIKSKGAKPSEQTLKDFQDMGEHLSQTERRAATAERETMERYQALHMAKRVGEVFTGHISGVTDFALFITLVEEGVSGILPLRDLGSDFYTFEPKRHRVVGKRTKRVFAMGDQVKVRLQEALPLKGALSFVLAAQAPTKSGPSPFKKKEKPIRKTLSLKKGGKKHPNPKSS